MGIGLVKTSRERMTNLACSDSSLCESTVARIMWREVSCGFCFPKASLCLGQYLLYVLFLVLLAGVIFLPMWLTLYSEEDKSQNGPFFQYFQCYVLLVLIQMYILSTWMCVCMCMCACMHARKRSKDIEGQIWSITAYFVQSYKCPWQTLITDV